MSQIYNAGIWFYECGINIATLWDGKARLWCKGRRGLLDDMASRIAPNERIVWIHAASLGEFEQGRPIIERIKAEYPDIKVLLTFFSPSGYEIRKDYRGADYVFYLPSDRPKYVRRFLDIVRPEVAIFIKYEFWLNFLAELRHRGVATYLISAIFRPHSIFFRPWGGIWREALRGYKAIYVQNDESEQLMRSLGITQVIKAGDTRFDRVAEITRNAPRIEIVERFKCNDALFVAGSTWAKDEELLIELINRNPKTRFVIAPHEMDNERIEHIINSVDGGAMRYTAITPESDISNIQVLILDTIGILSSVYGYARWAYIGGGFGRGIHNTLEAATFGLPLAFGTNYHKFQEACDMINLGVAHSVTNAEELCEWFAQLKDNDELYDALHNKALDYTATNCGATELILQSLAEVLR